ncbi:diguanylate cyclase [Maricaulis sp.]|uniref:sensor domain-containing diguanylate cyclase n=1 Tax=Maricaulis sp. TaxID=1486257 RepID=UPI002617026D|nr:diguanylate cyclase [Maricaulis sp.]
MPSTPELSPEEIRRMRLVVEHATDVIVLTDTDGLITWTNPAFTKLTGFSGEEALGQKPGDMLQGEATCQTTRQQISEALKSRVPITTEIVNYTKAGELYWVELNIIPIYDENGQHINFMSIEREISERKDMEFQQNLQAMQDKARRDERRLLSQIGEWLHACKSVDELLDVISSGLAKLLPGTSGGLFLYSNSRDVLEDVCRWNSGATGAAIEPDDCWALRRGRSYAYGTAELNYACHHVTEEPTAPYICIPVIAHGDAIGLLHVALDYMALHEARQPEQEAEIIIKRELALTCAEQISLALANVRLRDELRDQSVRDQLTGLFNRRWFLEQCRREIQYAQRHKSPFTLIAFDVDHFKAFNDNYGHDAGDMVLREVGEALASYATTGSTACRLGGEEFSVICPGMDSAAAADLAEELRAAIARISISYGAGKLPRITMSAGIAQLGQPANTVQDLMKTADQALYEAKRLGRDQVAIANADDPLEDMAAELQDMSDKLRDAS